MVDDDSLSRLHARIAVDQDGQLSIDDLGSTNGVFVSGAEQLSAYVMLGDSVRFGRVEYVVSGGDVPPPTEEEPVVSQTVPPADHDERGAESRPAGAGGAARHQPGDDGV